MNKLATIFILTISGFLIYSNILYAPFIFDDKAFIIDNSGIKDLSNFKDISGTRYIGFLSFALNYYFGGLNTFGYHLVNVIIHILNAILVYFFIQLTIGVQGGCPLGEGSRVQESFTRPLDPLTPRILPFAVALIFLVHPIQTQAVTYITQRFTSLATLFYLLAIVLYVKARINTMLNFKCLMLNNSRFKIKHLTLYCLSILSAVLAMKTKEFSFTLPFMIIFYEFTFFNKDGSRLYSRFFYLMPYLLTLLIIPLELFSSNVSPTAQGMESNLQRDLTATLEQGMESNLQKGLTTSTLAYNSFLTLFNVLPTFIRLLLFPANQHFEYENLLSKSIFEVKTFLSFISIISILCFAIFLYIRSRKTANGHGLLISFGIFWFFITISMNLIISIGVIFEHWLYLPSAGFILSAVAAYFYLFDRIENKAIKLILSLFIITAVISLAFAAYARNNIYKDEITIRLDEADKSPNLWSIHNELGITYRNKNMLDEAEKAFKKAIELNPVVTAIVHRNLGLVYEKKGLFDEAEREYLMAIKLSRYSFGAKVYIPSKVIDIHAHTNLGELYYKKGLFDEAISEYKEVIKISPSAEVYNYLGDAYMKKGLLDDAENAFLEALKLTPNDENILYNLEAVKGEKQRH